MNNDPAIAAIREVRHRISAVHLHDPQLLVDYYRELEREYQDRVLSTSDVDTPSQPVMTYAPIQTADLVLAETKSAGYSDPANADQLL